MKSYKQIVKQKGLEEREHQKHFLTSGEFQSSRKPFVLAAGTSAGKTPMATMHLEMFYSNPANKNKITLFVSASKTILRDNVHDFFKSFKPSFSYSIVKDKKTLQSALDRKAQVLVLIPQTIRNYYKLLPKIHTFILDEAHEWYFAKVKGGKQSMLDKILNHIQPTKQLLLTGTPSKFVADGNKFNFQFVPVMDLYDQGLVSNVKLEVVSSTYDFKASDWQGTYGNLKKTKTNSPKQAEDALNEVCKEMIDKLKNPMKEWYNVNNITKNSFGKLFKFMDKTIIYTHSKNQANKFFKILNDKRELKGKVLLSHSENDPDSIEFNKFKTDENYHILIAVDRGRIGFDMPNLKYIIDFTMTQNLDMLLQMYGRLLRLSKNVKNKTYFKVATKNTADYFVDLMTAMLCLTTMEWYSKYNGKNMGGIRIPKVLTKSIRNKQYQQTQNRNKSNKVKPYVSLTELGIPMDLNFFRQSILHTSNAKFNTIAQTTLDEVRREFFGMQIYTKLENVVPFDIAKAICKKHKIKNAKEYGKFVEKNKNLKLPKWPEITYKNEWTSYGDYLGTGFIASNELKNYRHSFEEAKSIIKPLGLQNVSDYKKFRNSNEENKLKFPANPDGVYKDEWINWGDFLGNGKVANQNKIYLSLNEAKKFLKGKNFDIHSWKDYTKSKTFPDFLPKDVYTVYGKDKNWKGLRDLFGTENEWNGVYKK